MKKLFLLATLCGSLSSYGSTVVINNMTDEVIYASIYCVNHKEGARQAPPQALGITKFKSFSYSCPSGRKAIIAIDRLPANLTENLSKAQLAERAASTESIGALEKNFFIVKKEGRLKVYNAFRWYLFKPIKKTAEKTVGYLTDPIKKGLKNRLPAVTNNPYRNTTASVRIGNELAPQERYYINRRLSFARSNLERFLGKDSDGAASLTGATPIIAGVFSGGGYRAMIATIGFLSGAQQIGLLDTISYVVGLSGSTWGLGTWMLNNQPIETFKSQFFGKLSQGLQNLSSNDIALMVQYYETKMVFDQPITIVDAYGALLANSLFSNFGDLKQRTYLSQLSRNVPVAGTSAAWPFPIFTAVRAEEQAVKGQWFEFTPYEIGGSWLGMYVPTWAWGRKFINGRSVDTAPEQTLGFNFGTYGSAFGATFFQTYGIISKAIKSFAVKALFEQVVLASIREKRPSYAEVFNFTTGMPLSPLRELKTLRLVDAGTSPGFNLPYPPISGERPQRKADIIILVDASAGTPGSDLKATERYARAHNLKFPPIRGGAFAKDTISIFKDDTDPTVPLVIYMPLRNDLALLAEKLKLPEFQRFKLLEQFNPIHCMEASFCGTFNFKYTPSEAHQLGALYEFNVLANADRIASAIKEWINLRDKK